MSFRGKVWSIIAILLIAFWWLTYQAYDLVLTLLTLVLK